MILARWTYTKDEWLSFLFRHKKKKSILRSLARRARLLPKNPEVVFTRDTIAIGDRVLNLHTDTRIHEINLYEEGSVNVMRLVFESSEVPIPIPRGKLKEALEIRKMLV